MSDQDKTVFHRPGSAPRTSPSPPGQPHQDAATSKPPASNQTQSLQKGAEQGFRSAPPMGSAAAPSGLPQGAGSPPQNAFRANDHFAQGAGSHAHRGIPSSDPSLLDRIQGLNPIVGAAQKIFSLYGSTRQSPSHKDIKGLNVQLKREIQRFEQKLQAHQYPQEIVLSARYVACSLLDEAVLNTPWGTESPWAQFTLLSAFHKETSGGEKFFLLLERMRQQPAANVDILEFMYVCLSLGFEGRFRFVPEGREHLTQLRADLFHLLKRLKPDYERDLSAHWRGFGENSNSLGKKLPLWVIGAFTALLALCLYGGIRYWLYEVSDPVVLELQAIQDQIDPSGSAPP